MAIRKLLSKRPLLKRLRGQEEEEQIYENVNAIEYFPDVNKAHVYVEGTKNVIEHVLSVDWMPPWSPKTWREKLPVVLFHADGVSTDIQFDPYVKIRYDPVMMTITILWGPTS